MKITRAFIRNNLDVSFIYGESLNGNDDYDYNALECRGEPNAYGIITCVCFSRRPETRGFKNNGTLDFIKDKILENIKAIPLNNIVCVLSDLGKGKSMMIENNPDIYNYMIEELTQHITKDHTKIIML